MVGVNTGVHLWVRVSSFPTSGHVINSAHRPNNILSKTNLNKKKSQSTFAWSHCSTAKQTTAMAWLAILKKNKKTPKNVFPWPTRTVMRSVKVNTAGYRFIALRLELLVTAISV